MTGKRRGMTAEELMRQLANDPEYQERMRLADEGRVEHTRTIDEASRPVLEALEHAGFAVFAIDDLFNQRLEYRAAVPVLMEWLPRVTNRDVKEMIVRALSVRWARPRAAPLLIDEFRTVDDDPRGSLRWAIGNALDVVADKSVLDDLLSIARDPRYGYTRQMIVLAIGRVGDERAVDLLIELLDDDDLVGHAVRALGKLRAKRARSAIERRLDHPRTWVRKEAKKALERLEKPPR